MEPREIVRRATAEGRRAATVTVTGIEGDPPSRTGMSLTVVEDGTVHGTLGCDGFDRSGVADAIRAMDALNPHELAWAAGFFDAEGYVGASRRTGRKTFRLQMSVSQAHLAPLQRFAKALGDQGNFFGPARGYLYYWYSHRFRTVCEAMSLLWPWLSAPKRTQFTLALAHRDAPCE